MRKGGTGDVKVKRLIASGTSIVGPRPSKHRGIPATKAAEKKKSGLPARKSVSVSVSVSVSLSLSLSLSLAGLEEEEWLT